MSTGFLVTRQWVDTVNGIELQLWLSTDQGPYLLRIPEQQAVCFIPTVRVAAALSALGSLRPARQEDLTLRDFEQNAITAFYFNSQRMLRDVRDRLSAAGITPLEADINPVDRYLMERFIRGSLTWSTTGSGTRAQPTDYQPRLRMLSLDIETSVETLEVYSIGVSAGAFRKVFMRSAETRHDWVEPVASEAALLARFCQWLAEYDPDVLIGWSVINFDLWYLQRAADKLGVPLRLGRNGGLPQWRTLDDEGERRAVTIPGRAVLDGIELLRTATYRFESFSLENVAQTLLGEGKLLKGSGRGEEIGHLFKTDPDALAEYNLRDCELVWDIFEHSELLQFAVARSQMTGLAIDRLGASSAAFDFLYLPRLHRAGFVAPNASDDPTASPGGFVMDSAPGIHRHVLVLDFKSLYPSIIRTFLVDPMGLALGTQAATVGNSQETIEGFLEASFSREQHLLPTIIEELWQWRDAAKARGDQAQSTAIKIIMNSFYGVLGSPGCRFFDPRLASSITLRGHQIIQETRQKIEAMGDRVIYGDTDSVFVAVEAESSAAAQARGEYLQAALNTWWQERVTAEYGLDSVLELEFETHFLHFLMPTVRGSEHKGSKKRYAGVVEKNGERSLVFKGLENVRTDWTPLARRFQKELYRRVFDSEDYAAWVREVAQALEAGSLDDELVYRKRLRRKLDEYERNVPPHVHAARLLQQRTGVGPHRGDWVAYVITTAGAEPADAAHAPLDYGHYLERQLAPVADGILHFLDTSFEAICGRQQSLF
ncbi:MAG: DNA polymerase II [Pseudomonadota bacterium]